MSKKQTPGERVADNLDIGEPGWRIKLERTIDRLHRKAQAAAWDNAIDCMERVRSYPVARRENPYRGRARK